MHPVTPNPLSARYTVEPLLEAFAGFVLAIRVVTDTVEGPFEDQSAPLDILAKPGACALVDEYRSLLAQGQAWVARECTGCGLIPDDDPVAIDDLPGWTVAQAIAVHSLRAPSRWINVLVENDESEVLVGLAVVDPDLAERLAEAIRRGDLRLQWHQN